MSTDFNLIQAVKEWRKDLEKHPGLEPGYIEELESHLRDKIDDITARGTSEKEAFQQAVEEIDDAEELATEFHKSRSISNHKPQWNRRPMFTHLLPNFLKITVRNFRKNKGYSFINIAGLGIGLACCILIFTYVLDELSYDRFHKNADRIYRVTTEINPPQSDQIQKLSTVGWPVGRALENNYPGVEKAAYIRSYPEYSIKHEGQYFFENMIYADQAFLELFSFPLLKGNPDNALSAPYSIILTEDLKQKYFGDQPALGKELILRDSLAFTITGIVENVPKNSHIQFDMLVSFATLEAQNPQISGNSGWMNLNMNNYILLNEEADTNTLKESVSGLYSQEIGEQLDQMGYKANLQLEPLTDIYLNSDYGNRLGPISNINYVYLLSAIGLFILGIACINFMNLATARSTERAREVGIRKVVGSNKKTLITQFMTESVITSFLSLFVAFGLIVWFLPEFNLLTGKQFVSAEFFTPSMILYYLIFVFSTGILAGLYPAFVLSGYSPLQVLGSYNVSARGGTAFRKGLVVFQFAISCILILCTLVVLRQLNFMQSQNLGFNSEQVVVMDTRQTSGETISGRFETIKQELRGNPAVESVSAAHATPGRSGWEGQIAYPEGGTQEESLNTEYLPVDYDYVPTLGLKILAGRNFSRSFQTDAEDALVINKAAVEAFGWETPENAIGKRIESPSGFPAGEVIGVVENYHHHGLQQNIDPIVMDINPGAYRFFAVRLQPGTTAGVINHMEEIWGEFFQGYTFDYFFLDQDFARQYRDEQRLGKIFGVFTALAIFIACLGLFGLATFSARKRAKEIGIRKVMGASASSVVMLLAKDFLLLVGIALLIAGPVSYYTMQQWLQSFANRIEPGAGIFAITAVIALGVAILSVSWQSMRAANQNQNPVNSIRSEH